MKRRSQSAASMANARLSDRALVADGMISTAEALRFGGFGKTKLFELLKSGDVVGSTVGRKRVVSRRSLANYVAARLERTDRTA
ncbi:MAG: hypothetical protein IAI48_00660 [Candidatus Eremiobacteraeota bacterium]|nr:hypothetical protein [Candidatus Eremiobacteraeota bacterium]